MTNLSLNELKLIVRNRNIKVYQNKPENDIIKMLSKPKSKITSLEIKYKRSKRYLTN